MKNASAASVTPECCPQGGCLVHTKLVLPSPIVTGTGGGMCVPHVHEAAMHNIDASFNSFSSLFLKGVSYLVEVRVTDYIAARPAILSLSHVGTTAHCCFPATSTAISDNASSTRSSSSSCPTALLDMLYCTDMVARCTVIVTPLPNKDSPAGCGGGAGSLAAVQCPGLMHPTGKQSALLLITTTPPSSSLSSTRLCATPTLLSADSSPDTDAHPPLPLSSAPTLSSSSSIGQKNLRRRRSILGSSSASSSPSVGDVCAISGIATTSPLGNSSSGKICGSTSSDISSSTGCSSSDTSCRVGRATENTTSSSCSPPPSLSPLSWVKQNATCIGNSPLTSPSRPSSCGGSLHTAAGLSSGGARGGGPPRPVLSSSRLRPQMLPHPSATGTAPPVLVKSSSCPSLITASTTSTSCGGVVSSPPTSSPSIVLPSHPHSAHSGTSSISEPGSSISAHDGYCPSSAIFTTLSPCGDSGSRSIFSELVLEGEGGLGVCRGGTHVGLSVSRAASLGGCGQEDSITLEYSCMVDEKRGYSPGIVQRDDAGAGGSVGLFSSVMQGAGMSSLLQQASRGNCPSLLPLSLSSSSAGETCEIKSPVPLLNSSTKTVINDGISTKVVLTSSSKEMQSTTNSSETIEVTALSSAVEAKAAFLNAGILQLQEHAAKLGSSSALTGGESSLLTLLAPCIFLRTIPPLIAAKRAIQQVYRKKLKKKEIGKSELISRLKQRNNCVSSLCKVLLLEVSLMRGGGAELLASAGNDSNKSLNKVISKSAACLLYIYLVLENENRMRKDYKSFISLATKPSTKGITKCFGQLKMCFELKSMASGTASKDAISWLLYRPREEGGDSCRKEAEKESLPYFGTTPSGNISSNSSSLVSSAPGELFGALRGGLDDIILQAVTLAREQYPHSSFESLLLATHAKLTAPEDDDDETTNHFGSSVTVSGEEVGGIKDFAPLSSGKSYLDLVRAKSRPPPPRCLSLKDNVNEEGVSSMSASSAACFLQPTDTAVEELKCGDACVHSVGTCAQVAQFDLPPDSCDSHNNISPPKECSSSSSFADVPLTQPPVNIVLKKAQSSSAAKKKNSLVSARVSLNGHRTSMESRLRSQQQVTVTSSVSVSGMGGGAPAASLFSRISNRSSKKGTNAKHILAAAGKVASDGRASKKQRSLFQDPREDSRVISSSGSGAAQGGLFQQKLFRSSSSSASTDDNLSMPPRPMSKTSRHDGGDKRHANSLCQDDDYAHSRRNKRPRPSLFSGVSGSSGGNVDAVGKDLFAQWRAADPCEEDFILPLAPPTSASSSSGGVVHSTPLPEKSRKGVIRKRGGGDGGVVVNLNSPMRTTHDDVGAEYAQEVQKRSSRSGRSVVAETPVRKRPPPGGSSLTVVASTPM